MRIEKLELNNFRGFEHFKIEFPKEEAGLAVLIGVNGSGKSSVLEAIVSFFERGMNKLNREKTDEGRFTPYYPIFSELDIKLKKDSFENVLKCNYFSQSLERTEQSGFLTLEDTYNEDHTAGFYHSGGHSKFHKQILKEIKNNPEVNLPIIAFYNSTRIGESEYLDSKKVKRYIAHQVKAYENALSAGLNFNDFEKWFIDRENNEYREKFNRKDFDYLDPEIQRVRDAVNAFFADWNMQNIHGKEGELNKETSVSSSLVIDKNGASFNLFQLSDGERAILLLVADIARRLTIANPSLESPLTGEGLILIDEIDLHLHPAWQRKIIPNLRKTFPNIQFIVTTHSPQVLSSVKRENVIILEDFKTYKSGYTKGRDSNSILAKVFGVPSRPEEAKKELSVLYRLIDDPKKEKEAEEMLLKLKEKYGENDPDLTQATLHLEFLTN